MTICTATYSPEDNKIRLYPSARLDDETFRRVKDAGYRWAPKQELFVAQKWTCQREDLAIELAGEIEAEETTLAERAQAKADRLEGIADRRANESSAYSRRADELSRAFEFGQPILVGHHSERKARKTQEKMHNAMDKSVQAHRAVGYWLYRATSVEHHANRKNDPRVRARRIKTLLAELRDHQRRINDAHKSLDFWEAITEPEAIKVALGIRPVPYGMWSSVDSGEMTPEDARTALIKGAWATINSKNLARWIAHTLNRLSYEREMLGDTPRFTGELKETTLQMLLREHGAEKPKAKKIDDNLFAVECDAPLPLHIGDGSTMELTADEWRELMQSCGYTPPEKKPAKPPILNFEAPAGKLEVVNPWKRETMILPQVAMTKADYGKIPTDTRGTRLSACGGFRVRIAPNPNHEGPRYSAGWAAIFISDQKAHPMPETIEAGELAQ